MRMRTTNPKTLGATARQVTSSILAALCLAAQPIAAQDPAPAQPNPSAQSTAEQPVSRPIPQRTIGLDPGKVVSWTMRDAIIAALEKNVDIELERENVKLAQYDILGYQGFYDPTATSFMGYSRTAQPTASRFTGLGDDVSAIQRDTLTYNYGLTKNLERYGNQIGVNFNNARVGSNNADFSPAYNPSLTVNFTQPLFKNFRIDTNRRQLKIAKKNLDLSDAVFRQRAIEIIATVQQAYWDLALAIRSEEVARAAVKLSETQLNNNKRQVEVGTLAPIDVVSAAKQLESDRQQVFVNMNQVAQAENALKALTVGGPDDQIWNARIEPTESFEIRPINLPLNDAVRLAQENRPEVKQWALRKEMNKIDIDFFRNQAKPQIDFVSSYGVTGLGGTPVDDGTIRGTCNNPIMQGGKLVCLGVIVSPQPVNGQYIPIVASTDFVASPPSVFAGGYGTGLKSLFKNSYRTWSVGLQFNFPLRNRTAQANLGRAKEQERQLDLQTRKQLQLIESDVRNAVQAVDTARLRSDAASAARKYAEQQLEGEEKKFQAGLSSTFFVLQRQTDLTSARFTELQAQADFNKAVANLQKVMSTTLSSNSIDVKSDVPPVK